MKRENAITLIALIITIIILLILAGVAIATLGGEEGLLSKVKIARNKYEMAEAKEKLELAIMDLRLDEEGKGETLTKEDLPKINNDEIDVRDTTSFPIEIICGKYKFQIDENFIVAYVGKADETIVTYTTEPEGYTNQDKIKILIKVANKKGIKSIEYPDGDKLLLENQTEVGIDYDVTRNETYTFKVVDIENNEVIKDIVIERIDKLEPKDFTPNTEDVEADGFTIIANVEDAEADETNVKSGIEKYEYYVDEKLKGTSEEKSYKITGLESNTNYSIYVIAYDKAGNSKKSVSINQKTSMGSFATLTLNGFEGEAKGINALSGFAIDGKLDTYVDTSFDGNYDRPIPTTTKYFYIDEECWGKYLSVYMGQTGPYDLGVYCHYYEFFSDNLASNRIKYNRWDSELGYGSNGTFVRSVKIPEGAVMVCLSPNSIEDAARYYEVWCSEENLSGTVY